MSGSDVEAVLSSDSPRQLLDLWNVASDRRMWNRVLAEALEKSDDEKAGVARRALANLGEASALDSLSANARLVERLTGWRWFVMEQAREEGASWSQIGEALGVSRQAAWEWYKHNIENQETYVARFHDASKARAALGTPED